MSGFDRVAPFYDRLKHLVFGDQLEGIESQLLNTLEGDADHVLIVGGGTGNLLPLVLEKFNGEINYVESSQKMITRARARSGSSRVQFHHSRLQEFPLGSYDIIITSFFLDVLEKKELEVQVKRLAEALRPSGKWLYADFDQPVRLSHKIILAAMLGFFRLFVGMNAVDLYNHSSLIINKGLMIQYQTAGLNGFLVGRIFGR